MLLTFNKYFQCHCSPGWTGADCSERQCPEGKHGAECTENCECEIENTESCHPYDGKCDCKPGWSRYVSQNFLKKSSRHYCGVIQRFQKRNVFKLLLFADEVLRFICFAAQHVIVLVRSSNTENCVPFNATAKTTLNVRHSMENVSVHQVRK